MPPCLNQSLPPRTCPFLQLHATLPESTPPSQNMPSFPLLYATLPESTPPFQNIPPSTPHFLKLYMRHTQYLPLAQSVSPFLQCDPPPPGIHPPFPLLYETLPEATAPSQNIPPSFPPLICGCYITLKVLQISCFILAISFSIA